MSYSLKQKICTIIFGHTYVKHIGTVDFYLVRCPEHGFVTAHPEYLESNNPFEMYVLSCPICNRNLSILED